MRGTATYRGQPLVALMLVLGGWVAVRAVMLDASHLAVNIPVQLPLPLPLPLPMNLPLPALGTAFGEPEVHGLTGRSARSDLRPGSPKLAESIFGPQELPPVMSSAGPLLPSVAAREALIPIPSPVETAADVPAFAESGEPAASHQLLWMMTVARIPLPASAVVARAALAGVGKTREAASFPQHKPRRWSTDGWLVLRQGSKSAAASGSLPASYGASQIGTVVRYRLAPASPNRPTVHVRATAALKGPTDRHAALGFSARPVAALPLAVAAEARVVDQGGMVHVAPAVFAYSELKPFALARGLGAEAYGQAGYVGGRNATAFADGHVRVESVVARIRGSELRAGAGVWGGAQKGASRLDVGPAAAIGIPVSESGVARMSLDWRIRVAGNAAPRSGPALTLSAGF